MWEYGIMKSIRVLYKKYREIINYLIFGCLTTVINLLVKWSLLFTILDATKDLELQLSVVISWIVAVIFAYITNRIFVFQSQNKNYVKEMMTFLVGRVLTLLLDMFIMWFFVTFLKLNSNFWVILFTIISQVLVIIINYILSKIFIFKKS